MQKHPPTIPMLTIQRSRPTLLDGSPKNPLTLRRPQESANRRLKDGNAHRGREQCPHMRSADLIYDTETTLSILRIKLLD